MTSPFNLRVGDVNLTSGDSGDSDERSPETPFRLLICGNLSGNRPNARLLEHRKPVEIDRDNFDEVLARIAPSVTIPDDANGTELTISFRELEEFEPDRLFRRLPVFDELRSLRDEIAQPATFPQAAAKVRAWHKSPEPGSAPVAAKPQQVSAIDLIQEVLGETRARAKPASSVSDDWQRFLAGIVQPHLVEKPDPRQADYVLVVEEAIGAQMRAILHQRDFQDLEAAWRSVHFLVKRLPTDETLKIFGNRSLVLGSSPRSCWASRSLR
jgi:type VI secretion system protein ImpC